MIIGLLTELILKLMIHCNIWNKINYLIGFTDNTANANTLYKYLIQGELDCAGNLLRQTP